MLRDSCYVQFDKFTVRSTNHAARFTFSFRCCKDQATSIGLQDLSDLDQYLLVEKTAAIFNDDHRTVIQEADTLTGFFAFLDNVQG